MAYASQWQLLLVLVVALMQRLCSSSGGQSFGALVAVLVVHNTGAQGVM